MGTGPFFYGKKSLTPERQRNGTSYDLKSALQVSDKKHDKLIRTVQVLPVRGGGPCVSTVVGASAQPILCRRLGQLGYNQEVMAILYAAVWV